MRPHSDLVGDLPTVSQRDVAEAMPVLVMMSGPDGVVTYFNSRWYEYTGQEPFERDAQAQWVNFLHPDDAAVVARDWSDAVARGSDLIEMQYRLREAATGEYRWFSARAIAMRDAGGNLVQWIGTAMDIHDEREAKLKLTALYEQQRTVASAFQEASLPPRAPIADDLAIDAFYQPNSQHLAVGGDWYDAFTLPDQSVVVSVGDVVGHGLEAAIIMGKIRYRLANADDARVLGERAKFAVRIAKR